MAYPPAAALQAASEVEALQALSDGDLADAYNLAIGAIEEFCGQKFTAETATRVFDGGGGRTLALDRRLADLVTLSVTGSSLQAGDVNLNDRRSELVVAATAGGANWVERVLREDQLPLFTAGPGTVTIEGIWGWTDAELDPLDLDNPIAQAVRMDMEDQALVRSGPMAETARVMAKVRSDRLSEGPLTVSTSQSLIPLSTEVQTLLADFIWQPVARVA